MEPKMEDPVLREAVHQLTGDPFHKLRNQRVVALTVAMVPKPKPGY